MLLRNGYPRVKTENCSCLKVCSESRGCAFPSDGDTKSYPCVKTEICLCQNVLHTQMKNLSGWKPAPILSSLLKPGGSSMCHTQPPSDEVVAAFCGFYLKGRRSNVKVNISLKTIYCGQRTVNKALKYYILWLSSLPTLNPVYAWKYGGCMKPQRTTISPIDMLTRILKKSLPRGCSLFPGYRFNTEGCLLDSIL